jgi:hypothetical protein
MRLTTTTTEGTRHHTKLLASGLVIAMTALSTGGAAAHVIPWRDGMSRIVGFSQCAKGPCMKRYDFSPSVRHAHLEIDGRTAVVMCTGLGRQHPECPSPWQGDRR